MLLYKETGNIPQYKTENTNKGELIYESIL